MMMRRVPRNARKGIKSAQALAAGKHGGKTPELSEFVAKADYTGAIALLEFKRRTDSVDNLTLPWLGYVHHWWAGDLCIRTHAMLCASVGCANLMPGSTAGTAPFTLVITRRH